MEFNNIKIFYETSAKTGEGIEEAFRSLSGKLLEKREKFRTSSPNKQRNILKMSIGEPYEEEGKKKKGCCK